MASDMRLTCLADGRLAEASLQSDCVRLAAVSVLCERGLLCGLQFLVALFRQVKQRVQLGAVERAVFGSA